MMLTIGKPTEYTTEGMAVIGQTDLDKPGWRLRYFDRGTELEIYRGSFAICRRIQEIAENIDKPEDKLAWIAELRELAAKLSGISHKLPTITLSEPTAAYTHALDVESPSFED